MNWNSIHSILFVPAQKNRLGKIKTLDADAYIIDLEDAIKDSEKELSRKDLKEYFTYEKRGNILLRINPNELKEEALLFSDTSAVKCIVIPKVESIIQIETVKNAFPGKDLMALIETPMGMINLREILETSLLSAVGFGAEDYCARTRTTKEKEYLLPLQSRLVMYCTAYNVPVYDMVNAEYTDLDKYSCYVKTSVGLGFTGKLAIHPNQISAINREFKEINTEKLKSVVREYESGKNGFLILDGEIYERPHIEQIKKRLNS